MKQIIIAPSLLAADFSEAGKALEVVTKARCPWLHLDIMDGHFVPNLTFGPKMVADLRKKSSLFFDAHLMVTNPENLVQTFIDSGADAITFHTEACVHSHRLVAEIKKAGKKAGISIVPSTPVEAISELLPFVDMVLVMTVNPGFGGQKLIPSCINKITKLAAIRKSMGYNFVISVDGGINEKTAPDAIKCGADVLVMGSAFFDADDPEFLVQNITHSSGLFA